jgi:hypothetical protein
MRERRHLIFPHDVALRHALALDTPSTTPYLLGFPHQRGKAKIFRGSHMDGRARLREWKGCHPPEVG